MTRQTLAMTATALILTLYASQSKAQDANIVVNSTTDDTPVENKATGRWSTPNRKLCTLRDAIIAVDIQNEFGPVGNPQCMGAEDSGTIHIPAGTYTLTHDLGQELGWGTIVVGNPGSGEQGTNVPVTLVGAGASKTIINGNGHNCWTIGARFAMSNLTIENCKDTALRVIQADLFTISNVSFLNNGSSTSDAGDIFLGESADLSGGQLSITGSVFRNNKHPKGGIIHMMGGNGLTLENSTIWQSTAQHGIIVNEGSNLYIHNCTIGANKADFDGIIVNKSYTTSDGADFYAADLALWNTTMAYNNCTNCPRGINNAAGDDAVVSASIIFGNDTQASSPMCTGSIDDYGYNLLDNAALCMPTFGNGNPSLDGGDLGTSNPRLDTSAPSYLPKVLGGNPGLPVYRPLTGSPALGIVGDNSDACEPDELGVRRDYPCAAGAAQ